MYMQNYIRIFDTLKYVFHTMGSYTPVRQIGFPYSIAIIINSSL
jgi:hypothetical protein